MTQTIRTKELDDGSTATLELRADGRYTIKRNGNRLEDPIDSKQDALPEFRRSVNQTNRGIELEEKASQGRSSGGMGSMGAMGGDSGGGFGLGDMSDGGGLFGGSGSSSSGESASSDGGGLFGGSGSSSSGESASSDGGGLFGGLGGSSGRKRDANSGRFAPRETRDVGFGMERDSDGRFTGRKDDDNDGGLLGFLR